MTFCLKTTTVGPESNYPINNVVILLHGYGGDGEDISMLSLNWKRFLPNTIFLCPDGHEECAINPSGFQWFDLTKDDSQYILDQSKRAEKKLFRYKKIFVPQFLSGSLLSYSAMDNIFGGSFREFLKQYFDLEAV